MAKIRYLYNKHKFHRLIQVIFMQTGQTKQKIKAQKVFPPCREMINLWSDKKILFKEIIVQNELVTHSIYRADGDPGIYIRQ